MVKETYLHEKRDLCTLKKRRAWGMLMFIANVNMNGKRAIWTGLFLKLSHTAGMLISIGLFCHVNRSLLPYEQVSFDTFAYLRSASPASLWHRDARERSQALADMLASQHSIIWLSDYLIILLSYYNFIIMSQHIIIISYYHNIKIMMIFWTLWWY